MSAHVDPSTTTGKAPLASAEGLSATGVKRDKHPVWYPPTAPCTTGLKMFNSLTEQLEPFAPRDGRTVKWYTCGPTVYDMSHMGHARAYLTFDILRRIMEDYFGYNVLYQMNITDIDDKIIKRARINKLVADFKAGKPNRAVLLETIVRAKALTQETLAARQEQLSVDLPPTAPGRLRDEREEKKAELALKVEQFNAAVAAVDAAAAAAPTTGDANNDKIFAAASWMIGDLLDSEKGASITDNDIFDAHARKYEAEFFTDMHRLGIRDPDVVSRVTEVVPQVVQFTQKIIDNGFAYVGESSVFFDTEAYTRAGHDYPKLKQTSGSKVQTTEDEMAEGEGALSKTAVGEKRSPNDFALWKFSKPGEPRWDSPWGPGRPGWHIECSVMASEVLGDYMDLHGGGCDLKFPHHDNELAQSEAYWGNKQWVNYFLHCGHLHIKGLKMSKSLKNFITIRQAMDDMGVTAREMRLLFLSNDWVKSMNFSDQSVGNAREQERVLRSFFGTVEQVLRDGDAHLLHSQGCTPADTVLLTEAVSVQSIVHEALCNNFDTVTAMEAIMRLVSEANKYFNIPGERKSATIVRRVGRYVTRMLQIFGVVSGTDGIGFLSQDSAAAGGSASGGGAAFPIVLDALVGFRDAVRTAAREKQPPQSLLPLCDKLRDETLPPAGVRLEDKPDGPTLWKLDDPAVLLREIAEKREKADQERLTKLANQLETKLKLLNKWQEFKQPPVSFFRDDPVESANYSAYDETGLPTAAAGGAPIDEKKQKKLKKDQDKYAAKHAELVALGGGEFLLKLEAEIAEMRRQLGQSAPAAAAAGGSA